MISTVENRQEVEGELKIIISSQANMLGIKMILTTILEET